MCCRVLAALTSVVQCHHRLHQLDKHVAQLVLPERVDRLQGLGGVRVGWGQRRAGQQGILHAEAAGRAEGGCASEQVGTACFARKATCRLMRTLQYAANPRSKLRTHHQLYSRLDRLPCSWPTPLPPYRGGCGELISLHARHRRLHRAVELGQHPAAGKGQGGCIQGLAGLELQARGGVSSQGGVCSVRRGKAGKSTSSLQSTPAPTWSPAVGPPKQSPPHRGPNPVQPPTTLGSALFSTPAEPKPYPSCSPQPPG